MNFFESLILGIVQGLTEFLPVSSSGHLLLIGYIFGNESSGDENLLFTIFVHLATAIATIYVFRKDVISLIKEFFKKDLFGLKRIRFISLDSVGYLLYFLNRIFFKKEVYPSNLKIFLWDKIFTPLTMVLDIFFMYKFGKCFVAVYKKV